MTVLQLVRGGKGKQELQPLPNPEQLQPAQMFRNGTDTFLAGSDDLIWIALGLSFSNFRVIQFAFVDRYFQPIAETEADWLSDQLVDLIEQRLLDSIEIFIATHLNGRFVEQVRLHNGSTHNDITVVQDGIVYAKEEDFASLSVALKRVNLYR
ncbi:hypothetical protein FHR72_003636 [Mycolicibacterium iranicum]|uniref:Uncharacterized protein n=1 Tax=Mycolicibacterium iranicum TaxID=912594 RepID=A0A839Q816_MYCIR|nr:hypothetical protein [Mycolicibacterium iranicum]MBB2992140.1 hypothetical protein [Mycolicibacterium iranicum]